MSSSGTELLETKARPRGSRRGLAEAAVHDNAVYYLGLNDSANLCDELSRGEKSHVGI